MKTILKTWTLFLLIACPVNVRAQDLSVKARDFLRSLSPDLRQEAQFAMEDAERENFHFVPMQRRGPTFNDFNEEQKQAALGLLRASLSDEGYRKSTEIMELEKVLLVMENDYRLPDGTPMRDPKRYHLCIFGDPSPDTPWGWRFEGHHISLNFTSAQGLLVSSTPTFFGSNPGIVPIELDQGKQVLKKESVLALQLVNSLSGEQRKLAVFSETAPREILTGTRRNVELLEPAGISYADLSPSQQAAFRDLLEVYISNYAPDFAETFHRKIMDAGLDKLHLAWAGGTRWGLPHYYRIQGPVMIIEYDNTQNNANHVHTAVRDLTNDFGKDFLREHYRTEHHD